MTYLSDGFYGTNFPIEFPRHFRSEEILTALQISLLTRATFTANDELTFHDTLTCLECIGKRGGMTKK